MKLGIGRQVHFVDNDNVTSAAIITRLHCDVGHDTINGPASVNLIAFTDGEAPRWHTSVRVYDGPVKELRYYAHTPPHL